MLTFLVLLIVVFLWIGAATRDVGALTEGVNGLTRMLQASAARPEPRWFAWIALPFRIIAWAFIILFVIAAIASKFQ
jgi:hypothetical protein